MSAKQTEKCTATEREREAYFSCEEQGLILTICKEKSNILEKSNTMAAARRRQNAWQRMMGCINA